MKVFFLMLSLAAVVVPIAGAGAQNYPSRPVRMVVPYPAGGTTDILGRIVSDKLSPMLGQPVVVENRSGASGNIGFDAVAKAAPDGYTLLMATANITINRAFSDKLPYNVLTDFAPISMVVSSQNLLVINPELPVKNVKELVAYAKANPGKLNFGSSGIGTPLLSIELLKSLAGVDMMHIPYKGDTPALVDLMANNIQVYCSTITGEIEFVRAGKLRALGVTSRKRAVSLPDIPTIEEAGVPGYELASWYGVLAPAGTPKEIVTKLTEMIVKIVAMPDVQQKMIEGGSDPMSSTVAEFDARIRADVEKFTKLVKDNNIRVE
jgi:tripartite-type tricarboxylate transporter receptor subunit TctC